MKSISTKWFTFIPPRKNCKTWLFTTDLFQISYVPHGDKIWGYWDAHKEEGIREAGLFERTFGLGYLQFHWYDYYRTHEYIEE